MKGFKGLRNTVDEERLESGDLATATNCDLDETGRLSRRGGYAQRVGSAAQWIWSQGGLCLFVSGTSLKRLHDDYTTTSTLRTGLTANVRMAYWEHAGMVFYSNGVETGIVQNGVDRSWGIAIPGLPMAANSVGELPAGVYQYALTYVRSDGQESGTGLAGQVTVTDGGIAFTEIPVSDDADVTYKVLYITPANGDVLYQAVMLENDTTSTSYGDDGVNLQMPLRTQFMQGAPAGQIVAWHKGRMYVVDGNIVYPSQPYSLELFDVRDFLQYPDRITLFAPVDDGIWIGTEKEIGFISGNEYSKKAGYGAIFGTQAYHYQQTKNGEVRYVLWTADTGICAGYPGGAFFNLTESRYRYSQPNEGCALLRKPTTGPTQYLTVLR